MLCAGAFGSPRLLLLSGIGPADDLRELGIAVRADLLVPEMGLDAMAVVDPSLRVRGVSGLRVADASVMPTLTSGNINAPVIMIGERAADLILSSG